jgi:hypothetical protein
MIPNAGTFVGRLESLRYHYHYHSPAPFGFVAPFGF